MKGLLLTLVGIAIIGNFQNEAKAKFKECPYPEPGGITVHLPHEANCTKFYKCSQGIKILFDCAPGTYYNEDLEVCDWMREVNCTKDAATTEKSNTQTTPFISETGVTHPIPTKNIAEWDSQENVSTSVTWEDPNISAFTEKPKPIQPNITDNTSHTFISTSTQNWWSTRRSRPTRSTRPTKPRDSKEKNSSSSSSSSESQSKDCEYINDETLKKRNQHDESSKCKYTTNNDENEILTKKVSIFEKPIFQKLLQKNYKR